MMIRAAHLPSIVALAAAAALLTGCSQAKEATGTYEAYFSANPEQVVAAARDTLEDLKFRSITATATAVDGELIAYTGQDKKVHIKVDGEGATVSKLSVRVGTLGDERISNTIIENTKARLD